MAEWQDQLNRILSDPNAMAQIASLAQGLSGSGTPEAEAAPPEANSPAEAAGEMPPDAAALLSGLNGLDPALLRKLTSVLGQLNRSESSETTTLLLALRPFLSEKRRGKVERAAQLARMIHLGKVLLTQGQEGGKLV